MDTRKKSDDDVLWAELAQELSKAQQKDTPAVQKESSPSNIGHMPPIESQGVTTTNQTGPVTLDPLNNKGQGGDAKARDRLMLFSGTFCSYSQSLLFDCPASQLI